MHYEVYFKDHGGYTFSVGHLDAPSDHEAIARAQRLYRCGIGATFEIWRRGLHLHTENLTDESTSRPAMQNAVYRPRSRDFAARFPALHR